jgi:hypothetical protein
MFTRKVELTDYELILLDTKVRPEIQVEVDKAKSALRFSDIGDGVLSEIIQLASLEGRLKARRRSIGKCQKCGAKTTYAKVKRGRNRGSIDFKRPLLVIGTSFMDGFITVSNYSKFGYCRLCEVGVVDELQGYILEKQLRIEIPDIDKTAWVREDKLVCRGCGKDMWQFDMGLSQTLMGDGFYYCSCPHCSARAELFNNHENTDEWRMVEKSSLRRTSNTTWNRAVHATLAG